MAGDRAMSAHDVKHATDKARSEAARAEARLWRALEDVNDPEFPVSVVDMGLIYGVQRQGRMVRVQLTFTAMGCPCMEFIIADVRERLLQEPDVDEVDLEIVWDPPWTRKRLSPKAVQRLRSWGVSA